MFQLSGARPGISSPCPATLRSTSGHQRLHTIAAAAQESAQQTIRIKLKAYELPLLKQSVKEILSAAESNGMSKGGGRDLKSQLHITLVSACASPVYVVLVMLSCLLVLCSTGLTLLADL